MGDLGRDRETLSLMIFGRGDTVPTKTNVAVDGCPPKPDSTKPGIPPCAKRSFAQNDEKAWHMPDLFVAPLLNREEALQQCFAEAPTLYSTISLIV